MHPVCQICGEELEGGSQVIAAHQRDGETIPGNAYHEDCWQMAMRLAQERVDDTKLDIPPVHITHEKTERELAIGERVAAAEEKRAEALATIATVLTSVAEPFYPLLPRLALELAQELDDE